MPKFFAQNLLSQNPVYNNPPQLDPEHEIESPLDTPELKVGTNPPQPNPPQLVQNYPDGSEDDFSNFGYYHDPLKTLISWQAPSRPFRKKDRSFYTTIAILVILISLIALLAGEKILVAALLAFAFLVYVLNFVPPQIINFKISTQGITIENHFYHWQELDSFWFDQKDGFQVLHVLTDLAFPAVLMVVLSPEIEVEQVKSICAKFLPFHEIVPKTTFEKWSESLQKHFPLENPHR